MQETDDRLITSYNEVIIAFLEIQVLQLHYIPAPQGDGIDVRGLCPSDGAA